MAATGDRVFDIVVASWNNLPYLRCCIERIRAHSERTHRIFAHVNEGADGTREWLRGEGIPFTESVANVGICRAFNQAARLGRGDLVCIINDDMVPLPRWDTALLDRISRLGDDRYMVSGTMVEPRDTRNPCAVVRDFGTSLEAFREVDLLHGQPSLNANDWFGSSFCPLVMSRSFWDEVGGLSEEFSPGLSSDPDLAMKCWTRGCRVFLGVGDSLSYHFQCKSTGRVVRNPGPQQFLEKWGMTQAFFNRYYLRKGERAHTERLQDPRTTLPFVWHWLRGKAKLVARRVTGRRALP